MLDSIGSASRGSSPDEQDDETDETDETGDPPPTSELRPNDPHTHLSPAGEPARPPGRGQVNTTQPVP